VVDGHAAPDERVNYERLARAFDGEAVPTADLDPPVAVSLSADEAAAAEAHADALATLGFETEPFGGGPSGSGPSRRRSGTRSTRPRSAMRSRPSQAGRRRGTPARNAARRSGVSPVAEARRIGDLDAEELRSLLDRLGECDRPYACPHGRPTVLSVDEATFAAGFGRDR